MKQCQVKILERDIKKGITDYLKLIPEVFFWVNHTTGIPDGKGGFRKNFQSGLPDIFMIVKSLDGVLNICAVEVKSPTGKLTEKQSDWLNTFQYFGGNSYVVNSVNSVIKIVETLKNRKYYI